MKLKKTVYGEPAKTFLAIPDHYVNVTGLYDAKANEVLEAGTVVNITDAGVVTKATESNGNGVVFNDIEVTNVNEKVNVTVLIHGFVRPSRLKGDDKVLTANPMIFAVE